MSSLPEWLDDDPVVEHHLGVLRSGKEAQVDLVERVGPEGQTCLLALKRYLPRTVRHKGELEAMGVSRASTFRNDVVYREGRQFRKTRDRRAVEQMTTYGKHLLQDRWMGHEHDVMLELHRLGVAVPQPVSFADNRYLVEYVGKREQAAPQLARARLEPDEIARAWRQVVDGLHTITAAGWVHADLSAYNLLWWDGRVWFIDFPQAVDLAANPNALDFLHRDVANITDWFNRRGIHDDPEEVFVDLLASAFG